VASVGLCWFSTATITNARESTAVSAQRFCRAADVAPVDDRSRYQRYAVSGSWRTAHGDVVALLPPQPREEVVFYRLVARRIIIATNHDNWRPHAMIGWRQPGCCLRSRV